jgi:cell division protease FtsH
MSERLGPITYKKKDEEVFLGRDIARERGYSERTAETIDDEVKRIIVECETKVKKLLTENRSKLEALASRLIEKEVLDAEEVDAIIKKSPNGTV